LIPYIWTQPEQSKVMKKQIFIILTHFLFLQALLFQVDLPDLVICFGEDGHIALELSKETEHSHDENLSDSAKYFQFMDQKSEDCNDLRLDLHFSNANVNKSKNTVPLHKSTPVFYSYPNLSNKSINSNNEVQPATNKQTISTIHNTILLI